MRGLLERVLKDHWVMLLGSIACLAMAFAFAEVGSDVVEGNHRQLDTAVREWMQSHHTDAGHRAFVLVTKLGERLVLIPLALVVGWRLFRGHWPWVVLFLFCSLASAELVSLLKQGFEVLRPPIGLQHSKSFAFPSGHTTATAAAAAFLGYLAVRRRVAPFAFIAVGAIVTLAVGFSRIYLDMHWTTDVIGGILIGSMFSLGCCALFDWLELAFKTISRRRRATSRLLPG